MHVQREYGRIALVRLAGRFLLTALLSGFLLSACRPTSSESEPSPTPFASQVPSQRVTTAAPIPISLQNLAANPDFYVGATLQLTGQFRRLPLLACEGEAFPSPATWGLEADGFLANASGMDEQLRSLLNEGQVITVEGRWLQHKGFMGCEGNLRDRAVWYLSTDRVLDPHPLQRSQPTTIAEAPPPTAAAELPLATVEVPAEQATATLFSQTDATETAVPSFTPLADLPATVITATATFTPTASVTAVGGVATPTLAAGQTPAATPGGSPTSTPVGGDQATATATLSASATPSGSAPLDKGELETEDLIIDTLGAGATDRWTLDLFAGDLITITVAPGAAADIVLSVVDSNGAVVVNDHNLAPAGDVETIKDLNIAGDGIHDLLIRTAQGLQTDYALMFIDSESYSFVFRGKLQEGSARNDTLAANNDHFWFFNAQSGESVSFSITPNGDSDPYIELYDPDGARMLTIDDTGEGEAESLDTYTLLDPGMYSIRVAEFDFLPMTYQIVLTKP